MSLLKIKTYVREEIYNLRRKLNKYEKDSMEAIENRKTLFDLFKQTTLINLERIPKLVSFLTFKYSIEIKCLLSITLTNQTVLQFLFYY